MVNEPIFITALGASTVVGRHAWATAAAVRAGIDGFVQHPYMVDAAGEPMRAAIAPWLDIDLIGSARFEALLLPAVDEVLAPILDAQAEPRRLALTLGLPTARPGLAADLQPALMRAINAKYGNALAAAAAFAGGHAAGLIALKAAAKRVAEGVFDACVVAAVDSYIAPETLEWLDECDQLHSGGQHNNPWGFIPGEGAGAILLARRSILEQLHLTAFARVVGLGAATEQNCIKTETVCIGEGLTAALRDALETLQEGAKISDLYSDMNGEPYRADEYGFATLRVSEKYEPGLVCQTPADCLGDVGAASGILFASLASIAAAKGYSKGSFSLLFCGSESGERSAAALHTPLCGRQ